MIKTGVDGSELVWYLEDHHFHHNFVLESINSLLSSGDIPGLFGKDELDAMLGPLKEIMSENGLEFEFRSPKDFFLHRVKQNLHVAIGMDYTHSDFVPRCMSNPALYTCCTLLWFGEWTRSSMLTVPKLLLKEELDAMDRDADALVASMSAIHASTMIGGDVFGTKIKDTSTPRDFVSMIDSYRSILELTQGELQKQISRMEGGLGKLQDASKTVDELSENAREQSDTLNEKQIAADSAMQKITDALQEASFRRSEVQVLQKELAEAESELTEQKAKIEKELSGIKPILMAAKKAVGQIKSDNLNEIRSLKMPPEPIRDVLSAVLMLLGIDDTSWLSMRNFLGRRGVKSTILDFDVKRITHKIRKNVGKVLKKKADSFEEKKIYRVSVAAAPLAAWVKANIKYSVVLEKTQPLQDALDRANSQLRSSQEKLEENERELKEIDTRVETLKKNFAQRTREAETLRQQLERTKDTLTKAETLLGKLGGEQSRWERKVVELRDAETSLPGTCLLAAAFCTYLLKCPEDVRARAVSIWRQIINVEMPSHNSSSKSIESKSGFDGDKESKEGNTTMQFSFTRVMSSESELLRWKSAGLPGDDLTMQNAVAIMNSTRTPFVIDPSTKATKWLQKHLKPECLPSQDSRFANRVELAVRFGKALMILEVDDVEPFLYPLVRKDLQLMGSRRTVRIGDKMVEYNDTFRMYVITFEIISLFSLTIYPPHHHHHTHTHTHL